MRALFRILCLRIVVLFSPTSQGRRYRSARIAAAADLVIIAIFFSFPRLTCGFIAIRLHLTEHLTCVNTPL